MDAKRPFQEDSYVRHTEHFKKYAYGGEKEEFARIWLEEDTVDAWRHRRMYQAIDPIIEAIPKAKWLTVGDGRYGKDAHYLLQKGCDVIASDISDFLLQEGKKAGYISNYKQENAEKLSFNDDEFDFIFCKESYHHFPRPMIALYEMIRVARQGVILIEPNDIYT